MKAIRFMLPAVVLSGAALVLLNSSRVDAYSTLGFSLSLSQRDFRVYNNFTDAAANNNLTPDDQFPGYQGATMAIWKACVEWGSLAHGDGSGDPTQSVLGSGGANFDTSFQGEATSPGGINDNVHSELIGGDGTTLAYTESPSSNGWRIRYLSNWTWNDGPGSISGSHQDLQSVACHEYGHALGLGHTSSGGATMTAYSNGGTADRSIESDDRAGVQGIYGVAAASKPIITSHILNASTLFIYGTNFTATGNEVWFTQAGTGGTGAPVKVTNVPSAGGVITVSVPVTAGSGDILVRNGAGNSHQNLSNAWPFDVTVDSCLIPHNFCLGFPNSVSGTGAVMGYNGTPSVTANDLTLTCYNLPPNEFGLFFYGTDENSMPFFDGLLCVDGTGTGGLVRIMPPIQSDFFGIVQVPIDNTQPPFNSYPGELLPGETKKFQFWYRDNTPTGTGANTSDGLSITFCD